MLLETWQYLYGDQPTQHSHRVDRWWLNLRSGRPIPTIRDWSGMAYIRRWPVRIRRRPEAYDPCNGFEIWPRLEDVQRWLWRELVISNYGEEKIKCIPKNLK